jgi:hypothetical protein
MNLRSIARALGGEISGNQVLAPGPGHGRRDRSLCVKLSATSPDGFIVHSFADDDFAACRDHVRQKLGLPSWSPGANPNIGGGRGKTVSKRNGFSKPPELTTPAAALGLWRESVDPRNTLGERYLASRKLELDDAVCEVLRWHAGIGALLALFRDIRTDEPRAISRTYLDREGRKIGRKFLGPVGGAAVKLDPDDAVLKGLHVGEGVETCMAARQLGLRPTWALGSAGAIAALRPRRNRMPHVARGARRGLRARRRGVRRPLARGRARSADQPIRFRQGPQR